MSGRLAKIRRIDDALACEALALAIAAEHRRLSLDQSNAWVAGIPRSSAPWSVGASIWQTPGGVQSEMGRINDAFVAFSREISEYLKAHGYPSPTPSPDLVARGIATLHDVVWTPLIQAWQKFYGDNSSWWGNLWWNHAPEAESFERQLLEVRASARRIGMPVLSPEPETFAPSILLDPSKNLLDEAHEAGKKVAQDTWKIGKIALIAGVSVAGLVLATSLVSRSR